MRFLCICLLALMVASCTTSDLVPDPEVAEEHAARYDWLQSIKYYRAALQANPGDAALLRGYRASVEQAVAFHKNSAQRFIRAEDFASAEVILSQGLAILPDSQELHDALEDVQGARKARSLYRDAVASARLGRKKKTLAYLEKALSLDPDYSDALALYKKANEADALDTKIDPIRLKTGAAVTINFKEASFKEAMLALGSAYGLNVIFDADVEDRPISIHAEKVEFTQALNLILKSNRSFYRRLGRNSIVIVPDTAEGRAEYEDYAVRTFYLSSIPAVDMAGLLTTSLGISNVSINESANSVTARDSREKLVLAEKLVDANDRSLAEVLVEVEILEVNRTKSERLGIDYGSQITLDPPQLKIDDLTEGKAASAFGLTALGLPSLTLRYFKQDVDAKTLASPRIRTIDKQEAHIHIGDRVPLRASTIQDATGQTRTTFNYQDIGIKMTITPEVKLNSEVLMNIALEVSSLGQNLGTTQEPAYAIGTRNVTTRMLLEDGETAVIGGLIREEERDTVQRVPGLGDIPAIGKLFQSRDGQGNRSDILLTLTPRIVRGRDIPSAPDSEFAAGSGARIGNGGAVDFIADKAGRNGPVIHLDMSGDGGFRTAEKATPLALAASANAPKTVQPTAGQAALGFQNDSYSVKVGDEVQVAVVASGFGDDVSGTATLRFRPDLIEVMEVSTPSGVLENINPASGTINLDLADNAAGQGKKQIATIKFKGVKRGLSYLVFSNSFGSGGENVSGKVLLQPSRVSVR